MRIAIGGLLHATSTFSRVPTTLGDFMRTHLEGEEILERRTGTKSALGGYIDAARDFMSRDQWHFRDRKELRPVSIDYMQIRMAEAASLNLNEHLVRFQQRTRDILEHQSFFEFVQNSGLHCLCLEDKNRLILS